jgi:hypothetical protein
VAGASRAKDTALTVAALVPAGLFLIMVVAGSMHGLVAFGRETLEWHDGWEYLVPATLDGVSVAFAFLAFRAVRRGGNPDRCYRVVWGAAGASAAINFSYEFGQSDNIVAGGYVSLLSVLSMVMFHEFLSQFETAIEDEGAQGSRIRRQNPKFGLRWITWPTNTFLAAVAWRNHPPTPGTPGTVADAVAHLHKVRAVKRETRGRRRPARPTQPSAAGPGAWTAPAPAPAGVVEATVVEHAPLRRETTRRAGRLAPAERSRLPTAEVRVPLTEQTLLEWAETWVRVCSDTELWSGPWTDDDRARQVYGRGARQLRRLRQAVLSGALRRQAGELGVRLPAGFVDQPESLLGPVGDDGHG